MSTELINRITVKKGGVYPVSYTHLNIELSGFEVRLINAMSRERVLKTYVNEVKKLSLIHI